MKRRDMSSSRQRMLDAFEFNNPDKIPVVYHPSPAGLYRHGKKLLDLFNEYPPDNPVTFDSIPAPPPGTIDPNGRYYEIRQDEWGTEWEYRIYGIQGHPRTYPFAGWEEAKDYNFPPIPILDKTELLKQRRNYLIFSGWISIFEKLHALRPMDEVLMDLFTENKHLLIFLDRLVNYWLETIEALIKAGVDVVVFGDDYGAQSSSLISPGLFHELFRPRYQKLMEPVKKAGAKVFFHSCGYLGEILDELFDLGIDGLWPQLPLYENDPKFAERCKAHRAAIYIHPDRQKLIPLGTVAEIKTAIHNYAETYHRLGGGGIFYIEIENDAPFENVEALIKSVHNER
ncbi:MAG TPA: hypothetical protein ENH53_11435 [Bacteroidetes bacterium]|nr:hypothetical protein [Bacteroidota bacterium]